MFRKALRLALSFVLILSIGYSQLFLAFYGGTLDFASSQGEPVKVESRVAHFSPKVKTDHSADQQNQDWDSEVLEKDPDEYTGSISLELQLAFGAVFICLLSLSFRKYHVRFLRYYRNFFYIHTHRLHVYNGVFTI
ncbi:hypothetical protein J0A68_16535 [Algoriphagus sp. H41]|uniref:Uncharacterized protein n=1 Tax=Algoriphagus oliviformis TaxID=2811231 RepID=A0ABS3C623_9BACT|nr:hypothetical protein [Algoriphagus oliviformis]MBN7812563.1 hypothetical protein [Algoriphagus oliviformis]